MSKGIQDCSRRGALLVSVFSDKQFQARPLRHSSRVFPRPTEIARSESLGDLHSAERIAGSRQSAGGQREVPSGQRADEGESVESIESVASRLNERK